MNTTMKSNLALIYVSMCIIHIYVQNTWDDKHLKVK
jgi:hypothetical protein